MKRMQGYCNRMSDTLAEAAHVWYMHELRLNALLQLLSSFYSQFSMCESHKTPRIKKKRNHNYMWLSSFRVNFFFCIETLFFFDNYTHSPPIIITITYTNIPDILQFPLFYKTVIRIIFSLLSFLLYFVAAQRNQPHFMLQKKLHYCNENV